MIIDAHAHLTRKPDFKLLEKIIADGNLEQIWLMDVSGCGLKTHDFASEDEIIEVSVKFPDVYIPFGYLDLRKTPDDIDRLKGKGFFGLKAYRPEKPYDAPEYFPFYERADKLGMPILFHTGMVEKCPKGKMGDKLSFGPTNMRPSQLSSIAAAFPGLITIGGHLGYPWLEETAHNLYYYPNIYHDLSGYRKDVEWLIKNLDRKCNDGLPHRYFNDKILFATDALCYGEKNEYQNILKMISFWQLFLDVIGSNYYRWGQAVEREKIFYANARKIYDSIVKRKTRRKK
jgi:predicted TIM-barrel fold metal-dependent hydrolase